MSRENSPYVVGDFWLDKRRDGKAPSVWQIATAVRRTIIYCSTSQRELEPAKAVIDAHFQAARSLEKQQPSDALVAAHLVNYWKERGKKLISSDQTERSLRHFIGFLMQDTVGVQAVITDLTPNLFERFRAWRMGEHVYLLDWFGETYSFHSNGVAGPTVQRNINDVRAAVHHAVAEQRIPMAPKIKDLAAEYHSVPRERTLTIKEMARIAWYCSQLPDKAMFRFVALQFATAVRPQAALAFDPTTQYRGDVIDLQPEAKPQTKKRNAIVPVIRPMRPILRAWAAAGADPVKSRKTAWRNMRKALGLSADVHAKTIRHTVATILYSDENVPERQVSELLGHAGDLATTTRIYAKYKPTHLRKAVHALTILWLAVSSEARRFGADHLLTTDDKTHPYKVVPKGVKL